MVVALVARWRASRRLTRMISGSGRAAGGRLAPANSRTGTRDATYQRKEISHVIVLCATEAGDATDGILDYSRHFVEALRQEIAVVELDVYHRSGGERLDPDRIGRGDAV